ncbi:MAG: hypothetical protein ACRDT4_16995 [Micromonosporaceae bacterium]
MTDPRIGPVADRDNPPRPVDEPVAPSAPANVPPPTPVERTAPPPTPMETERTAMPPPTPVEQGRPVAGTAPVAPNEAPATPWTAPPGDPNAPTAPPVRERTDWDARDRRDETPRHAAGRGDERLIGEDERLAVGEPDVDLRSARVSWMAVIGLLLGVVGVLGALTAELQPVAGVIGVVGLLFAIAGLYATRHRLLASRPLAVLAVLVCLGAVALVVVAYTGQFDWLDRTDQVGWLRQWLDDRIPGLASW